jgi:hypothetical protein
VTWFKVDDSLAFHPKVLAAGNAAMGLWVRAGAYCAHLLTDGWLPDGAIPSLGGRKRDADALVRAGLWERVDGGYRFHQWGDRNPAKSQVEAERAAARERMQAHRFAKRSGEQAANFGRSSEDVRLPRPDPSRKELLPEVPSADAASEPPPKRRKPQRPLPSDWVPSEKHRKDAAARGIDVDLEAERFRNHAWSVDRRMSEPNAAFANWLTKAKPTQQPAAKQDELPSYWKVRKDIA